MRKENNQIKLKIDLDQLRINTYKTMPRPVRDDFFKAPLRVNLVENIDGQMINNDSFNVEIHMPRFEIITTTDEVNRENSAQDLLKTTTTHHITGH